QNASSVSSGQSSALATSIWPPLSSWARPFRRSMFFSRSTSALRFATVLRFATLSRFAIALRFVTDDLLATSDGTLARAQIARQSYTRLGGLATRQRRVCFCVWSRALTRIIPPRVHHATS